MAMGKRVRSRREPDDGPTGKRAAVGGVAPGSADDPPRRAEGRPVPPPDHDQQPVDPSAVPGRADDGAETPVPSSDFVPPADPAPPADVVPPADAVPPAEPPPPADPARSAAGAVPWGVRVAASWSWRVLLVAALVLALGFLFRYLSEVTIPIAVATLLAALLSPVANRLKKWRVPRALAAAISVVGGLALVAGVLTFIVQQIVSQSGELASKAVEGYQQLLAWLGGPPFYLDYRQLSNYGNQVLDWLQTIDLAAILPGYAANVGSGVGHFLAGFAITLFALFYFLYDGRGIFSAVLRFVPRNARPKADAAARNGWSSLVAYVRATIAVAFVDAIGVLIIALILRVPLAIPLSALVFLGAFIPLVGAFVSGFVAVAVALVAVGPIQALIMLAGIIVVMQVEGHVLQPFLLGRAVALHPLAVLLAIAIGVILGGIVGAVLAVPLLAFANSYISSLAAGASVEPLGAQEPAG